MFVVLLFAGAPAILFGGLEARRNYELGVERERAISAMAAERTTANLAEVLDRGWRALELASALPEVRARSRNCNGVLDAVRASQGYLATALADRSGQIVCSSPTPVPRIEVANEDWFKRLALGETDRDASALVLGPVTGRPAIVLAAPMRSPEFEGAIAGSFSIATLEEVVRPSVAPGRGVYVFDRNGAFITGVTGEGLDGERALETARRVARRERGVPTRGFSVNSAREETSGLQTFVVATTTDSRVGLRAALTALAPLLAVLLGVAAVYAALEVWVLRYFGVLEHKAKAFAAGLHSPARMTGAPPEFRNLAQTLEHAFSQARERELDLERAAHENRRLSRELHHRVKNNLQVMTSLANRQQKRAGEPMVRAALTEARARMLAVALVHRFIDPPEHLGIIDFDGYLSELARQLHLALSGESRNVTLEVDVEPGEAPVDQATVLGLIVAEAFIAGYRSVGGLTGATTRVISRNAPRRLLVETIMPTPIAGEPIDADLVAELTRQAGGKLQQVTNGSVEITWTDGPEQEAAALTTG